METRNCKTCSSQFAVKWPSDPKQFCSRSCSAKHNNVIREPRSEASRLKTSESVKQKYKPRHLTFWPRTCVKRSKCSFCESHFWARAHNGYYGKLCSDACLLNSKRKNATGIKRYIYNEVVFDSNWEVMVAKQLDAKNIKWIRPSDPIKWLDSSQKIRKYFPDFYLPDFKVYLDPKNRIVCNKQAEKLSQVTKLITLFYGTPSEILASLERLELPT